MTTDRDKAKRLLKRMTVAEKTAQLVSAWLEIHDDGAFVVKEIAFREDKPCDDVGSVLGDGLGQLTRPFGTHANDPKRLAHGVNEIQRFLVEHTRLGIPAMLHEECLSGAMITGATVFSSGLNYGSSWDPDLVERSARIIGDELRSLGIHQALAPVLDVARDARWGRNEETFGEDPYLVGMMAIAYIRGLQGPSRSPLATMKHFLGHSSSEGARNHAPVHVGERELRNIFGLPFEMAVMYAAPGAVMPAYHDIDGIPATAAECYVTDLLQKQWGFDGLVVTDYEAISQLRNDHHVAKDYAEAAALALQAGMHIELPSSTVFKEGIPQALERGLIDMRLIDARVLQVLEEKYRQGIFDHPYIDVGSIELTGQAHHDAVVELAEKSIVLLKNDGILPLAQPCKVAIIGPLADHPYAMFSGYSVPVHLQGSQKPEETVPKRARTIRRALEDAMPGCDMMFEPGCMLYERAHERAIFFPGDAATDDDASTQELSADTSRIPLAVEAARNADVTILAVGDVAGLFRQGTVSEGSDASSLRLPGVQEQLMDAVLATGKPVVVLLVSGRPYSIERAVSQAAAILATWLPGEGGGEAVANILSGKTNPSGKTVLSFPYSAGAMPYAYDHSLKSAGMVRQSQFGAVWPFGHGLSFTTFAYEDIAVEPARVSSDGVFTIDVTVRNTGDRAGDEIVQLYAHDRFSSIVRPVKELKGFARVHLETGQAKHIVFTLPVEMLSFVGKDLKRIVEPGDFDLMIGSSSERIVWTQVVTVTGCVRELGRKWKCRTDVRIENG